MYSPGTLLKAKFNELAMARRMLQESVDEVARNGALSKINFGQRFS
jgi:hypothetical protein